MRGGWKALLFLVAYWIVANVLEIPVVVAGLALKIDFRPWVQFKFGPLLGVLAGVAVTAAFLAIERKSFRTVGLNLNARWARELALGTLGGIVIMVATALALLSLDGFHWVRNPQGSLSGIVLGLLIFLAVALNEEIVYRGYPFQRLVEHLGPWPTQLLLAGLFTLHHWGNPGIADATPTLKAWTTLNIALAAVLLGLCYLKTKSLALPVGVHLGWNWAQGSLLGFHVSGTTVVQGFWTPSLHDQPAWLTGGVVGLEGSAICSGAILIAILGLLLWRPKKAAN
ncbi:MAG: type II CAAX endopeptidase family protein [Holophaga sp.]|nr:type II CAAX endopeptidase family protein [Holophaga sp.]